MEVVIPEYTIQALWPYLTNKNCMHSIWSFLVLLSDFWITCKAWIIARRYFKWVLRFSRFLSWNIWEAKYVGQFIWPLRDKTEIVSSLDILGVHFGALRSCHEKDSKMWLHILKPLLSRWPMSLSVCLSGIVTIYLIHENQWAPHSFI